MHSDDLPVARHQNQPVDVAIVQLLALWGLCIAFVPSLRAPLLGMTVLLAVVALAVIAFRGRSQRVFQGEPGASYGTAGLQEPFGGLASTSPEDRERDNLRTLDWFQFEKLVALLFEQEGFVVKRKGGARSDGGIDLTATKDGVTFGVQCKHWKSWRVGVEQVRAFLGALHDHKLANGFMVTLEGYTNDASDFARRNNIDLLDERTLRKNLDAVNWRFNPAFVARLNDPRKFCPKCESELVRRVATRGAHVGKDFWGCSTFPRCTFRMSVG